MPRRTLPGTLLARLQEGLVLTGALIHRGIAIVGLRSIEYAFTHETKAGRRELRKPVLLLVRVGYWMLGGVTMGKWDPPVVKSASQSKQR